jgi:hypothetical protein
MLNPDISDDVLILILVMTSPCPWSWYQLGSNVWLLRELPFL